MTYIMAIGIDNLLEAIKRVGLKGMTLPLVEEALLGPVLLLILFSIISSITSFYSGTSNGFFKRTGYFKN